MLFANQHGSSPLLCEYTVAVSWHIDAHLVCKEFKQKGENAVNTRKWAYSEFLHTFCSPSSPKVMAYLRFTIGRVHSMSLDQCVMMGVCYDRDIRKP